jgi:YVTN family beta-propeller protein
MRLALSSSGKILVSANLGLGVPSLTVFEHGRAWETRHLAPVPLNLESCGATPCAADPQRQATALAPGSWRSVSYGLAFSGEHSVFVAEGYSGKIALIDLASGERRRVIDLDQNGYRDSVTGELVLDPVRNMLYAADQANLRIAVIDARSRQAVSSIKVDGLPLVFALSPDRRKLYVALAQTGVSVINVSDPATPKVEALIPMKDPSGIAATRERVYVTDSANDSVIVIDAGENRVQAEIPIRMSGLTALRGVLPAGVAYDQNTGWLLVAEAGINAVGIIEAQSGNVLGHVPVGWFPTYVLIANSTVYVANLYGRGGSTREAEPGSVSIFRLPAATALPAYTDFVMRAAGLMPPAASSPPFPKEIQHVVLIVKSGQTFDEVLGDLTATGNGRVMAMPGLARFGRQGYANGRGKRLSLQRLNITPNLHAIAQRWSFSDNFYADSLWSAVGRQWLAAAYPDAWTEALLRAGRIDLPEDRPLWRTLTERQISFYSLGTPGDATWNTKTSDTDRASRFIQEIEDRFAQPGADLPRFVSAYLPNDSLAEPRPEDGYPYAESFAADNDMAVGRILAYLSASKWWRQMAVFITEDSARGPDHVDARRTLLLCAGPWAKKSYVSHRNASFPALIRTICEVLGLTALNLYDASAASLSDCFTPEPDFTPYQALPSNPVLYEPR